MTQMAEEKTLEKLWSIFKGGPIHVFFKVFTDSHLDLELDGPNPIRSHMSGDKVVILLNRELAGFVPIECKNLLWKLIEQNTKTTLSAETVARALNVVRLYGTKATSKVENIDLVLQAEDRCGVDRTTLFSCRSEAASSFTLLNAGGDNTNFVFEVTGGMDDEKMERFNGLFRTVTRKEKVCHDIGTAERMNYLHEIGCDLRFVGTAKPVCRENLIKCGGMEMPEIVGAMVKKFYYENLSSRTTMEDCIECLAENDTADYRFDDPADTYRGKIAQLLIATFTGMRLGIKWNGRQEVNGGYIVVKNDGDVVAFHSTIADEFKDFLVAKMIMESPSHSRHKDMVIYKEGDRYLLKLALQLRFVLNR